MMKLGYELMLCVLDDQEFFKGCVCVQKQLYFMDQLFDIIWSLIIGCFSCLSLMEYFEDIREKNEVLLGEFFFSFYLQMFLNLECDLWFLDMQFFFNKQSDDWQWVSVFVKFEEEEKLVEFVRQLQESVVKLYVFRMEYFVQYE